MNTFGTSNKFKADSSLKVVKQFYMDASGGDRVINFQEFIELFGRLNPQYKGPNLISYAERAFMTADTNYDGHLTYDEFIKAFFKEPQNSVQPNRNNFKENLSSLLGIHSNQHKKAGFLRIEEAFSYLNWIHSFYGRENRQPPTLEKVQKKFSSKSLLSYKDFISFIEPYYR